MECSCPDYASSCKHIAAVFYALADNLDEDPFLLPQLNGKNKDEIMKSISMASHPEDEKETSTQPDGNALSNEVIYKFWDSSPVNIKVNRGSRKHTVFLSINILSPLILTTQSFPQPSRDTTKRF